MVKDRVSILHVFSGDLWAGAEVMIFNLLNRLKNAPGVTLMALSLNEGILTDKLRTAGVETCVIPEATNSLPMILAKAFRLLRHRSLDIIHSHRYKENLLALLLAKSLGIRRLVTTLHGLSEIPALKLLGTFPIPFQTGVDCAILKRYFTRVVAVSLEMGRTLTGTYRFSQDQVDVIHNGVPVLDSLSGPERSGDRPLHIGTVGRLVPVKDYDLFLEVAAAIRGQTDNVRFSILGDGPLKTALGRKTRDLGLTDCVELLPPRPDPTSYYQSLDIYLNTSRHEGLPLSLLEAMAWAKPVVAAQVGGIPEIISHGDQGLLVSVHHPAEFARACMTLIDDAELRITMGGNASRRVRRCHTDSRMAECYQNLYLGLVPVAS